MRKNSIQDYCHFQHLKYMAHVCRMENDAIQKQALFDIRTTVRAWKRVEDPQKIDEIEARKVMMDKVKFSHLL